MGDSQPSQPYLGSGSKARTALQGALAFGVGGLLEILSFQFPALLERGFIASLAGPLLGGAVGGAWLGWAMRKKVRWATEGAVAFGIGFLPAALAMVGTLMVAGEASHGNESPVGLALFLILGFGIGFGISGAIAGALVFGGWRLVVASARAFAAAGLAGGILVSVGLLPLPAFRAVLRLGAFAGIVVPYLLGGALLGAAVPGLRTRLRETAQKGPTRSGPPT